MEGTGTRWGILVHEATHFAAATQDHAYGRAASLALARSDPARAAENADSYMLFVETLPRR
jgi:peptidyl-Lys metalloendopeptidase